MASPNGVNPGLRTTTQKPLDEMTPAHRAWILRWEPMLDAIGAEHVWDSAPRFKGHGDGEFYLAVKVGSRNYAIVSFDTSKPTMKAMSLVSGIQSPKTVRELFVEYKTKAKAERDSGTPVVEATPALLDSQAVHGPDGRRVQVLFYNDESIRFRIYDSPLVIEEAFLTGNKGQHAIIKVGKKRPSG